MKPAKAVPVLFLLLCVVPQLLAGGQANAQAAGLQYAELMDTRYGEAIKASRELVRARLNEYPGLSVAVGIDGHIVWTQGFGWADIEQGVRVRPSSRFRVGSTAKPMTAALLAHLYQDGLVDLDAPVQRYVPDFPEKNHAITIRQLAGHISGIRHYQGDEFLNSRYYDTVSEGLDIFEDDPLLFEPGTQYSYSSYAWNLISAVIEGATEKDFLPQMDERVFTPLGMVHTVPDQNHLIVRDRVRPYERREGDGVLYNAPYVDNSYKWAGGGFVATAEDLVRFAMGHMKPGYLKADTLKLLFTSQKTADGKETGYGVGWRVAKDEQGRRMVGHGGGSVGGSTLLRFYPDHGLAIVMITNMGDGPGFDADEIVEHFLKRAPSSATSPSN